MWTKFALAISLLLSSLLICTIFTSGDQTGLFALSIFFLLLSFILRFHALKFVAGFVFLWPLIPSESTQFGLPQFNYYEYFLVSLVFWWSLKKLLRKESPNGRDKAEAVEKCGADVSSASQSLCAISAGGRDARTTFNLGGLGPFFALFLLFSFFSAIGSLLSQHLFTTDIFFMNLLSQGPVFRPWQSSWLPFRLWLDLLEGIWLFIIIIDTLRERKDFDLLFKVWIASSVLVALIGIVQYLTGYGLLPYWIAQNPRLPRINSTFSDPNSLAAYLGASFFLAVTKFSISKNISWLYLLASLLIGASLALTFSRVALASIFFLFFLFPIIFKILTNVNVTEHTRGVLHWSYKWGFVSVLILAFLLLLATFINFYVEKPQSLMEVVLTSVNTRVPLGETLKGRPGLWTAAVQMFIDKPFFGQGLGSFMSLVARFPYSSFTGGITENAHNYYLQLLAERGLVGISLFLLPIVVIFQIAFSRARDLKQEDLLYVYGLILSLLVILMTSLTGHPLLLLKLQLAFFTLLALLFSITRSGPGFRSRFAVLLFVAISVAAVPFQIKTGIGHQRLNVYEYGYHAMEKDREGNPFHWSGDEAVSLLKVQGKVLTLKLRQLNPEVTRNPLETKIYINDDLIDNVTLSSYDPVEVSYFLPAAVLHKWIRLHIKPEQTFSGIDYGLQDTRKLGVMVYPFDWSCSIYSSTGFFAAEQNEGNPFMWSRKQASLLIKPHGRSVRFPILPNAWVEQTPIDVDFYWNDNKVTTIRLANRKWENITLRIPDDKQLSGVLTLRVSKTWNPRKMKASTDGRDLGVAIGQPVWLETNAARRNESLRGLSDPFSTWILNTRNKVFKVSAYELVRKRVPRFLNVFKNLEEEPLGPVAYPSAGFFMEETLLYSQLPGIALQSKPWSHRIKHLQGPISIRFRARAYFIDSEAPLVSVRLNGREIARHEIGDEGWRDYITETSVPSGFYELSLSVLNAVYVTQMGDFRTAYVEQLSLLSRLRQDLSSGADARPGVIFSKAKQQILYQGITQGPTAGPLKFEVALQPGIYSIQFKAQSGQSTSLGLYLSDEKLGTFRIHSTNSVEFQTEEDFLVKTPVVKELRIVPDARDVNLQEVRLLQRPAAIILDPIDPVHDLTPSSKSCFFLKEIY